MFITYTTFLVYIFYPSIFFFMFFVGTKVPIISLFISYYQHDRNYWYVSAWQLL